MEIITFILFVVVLLFLFAYVTFVFFVQIGWRRTFVFNSENSEKELPFLSLLVCCRNEAEHLPALFSSIENQIYKNFEVVFVDDHSSDGTLDLLLNFAQCHEHVKVLTSSRTGKKYALAEACAAASSDLFCCTDADCRLNALHLRTIACFFRDKHPDLILGGVKMIQTGDLFQQIQALEFMSLVVSGAGTAGIGRPVLSNGANIAFTRRLWSSSQQSQCMQTPSGDDQFLLFYAKKSGAKILFLMSSETIVETEPCWSVRAFANQRARWASKSRLYTDADTICVAMTVFGLSLLQLFLLGLGFVNVLFWKLFVLVFVIKFLVDSVLLLKTSSFFGLKSLCRYTFLLSILYPFYVVFSAVKGLCGSFNWKNRKYCS